MRDMKGGTSATQPRFLGSGRERKPYRLLGEAVGIQRLLIRKQAPVLFYQAIVIRDDDGYAIRAPFTGATRLVNTNDAFTGVNAGRIGDLEVGESKYSSQPWDAGTEGNIETAATIPGPAGGGEGFN